MKKETFIVKVFSFRNIETPFAKNGHKNYYAIIDVENLPDLKDWRDINVRDPKTTGSVPRKITRSFHENDEMFLFMNRGITVSVESATFNNRTSELQIVMSNKNDHGLLDGGHTYSIIREEVKRLKENEERFVKFEILEGFTRDDITDIVEGRNTSNQVKDQSLMELEGQFEGLKRFLPKGYEQLIAFSEYETGSDGYAKPIDIRDVITLLTTFNNDLFDNDTQPVIAYSGKQQCLKKYKESKPTYEKIFPLVKDIINLYNEIYLSYNEFYGELSSQKGYKRNGFGNLTGITTYPKPGMGPELYFEDRRPDYAIPAGFIYPVLAAFRALVVEKDGVYAWGKNCKPISILKKDLGVKLVGIVTDEALKMQNPTKMGKSALIWKSCYQEALLYYLKK